MAYKGFCMYDTDNVLLAEYDTKTACINLYSIGKDDDETSEFKNYIENELGYFVDDFVEVYY